MELQNQCYAVWCNNCGHLWISFTREHQRLRCHKCGSNRELSLRGRDWAKEIVRE